MKTILAVEDIKNIIQEAFNSEENRELIAITDNDTGETTEVDIVDYLNIKYYVWRQRLIDQDGAMPMDLPSWIESINYSIKDSYALVEILSETVTMSEDIDNASKSCKVTFIVQSDKLRILDHYISKIRNAYLGKPILIQNSYGDTVKAFMVFGNLVYVEEPSMTQLGECVIASLSVNLAYMTNAKTYNDISVSLSLSGKNGYYEPLVLTKCSWANSSNTKAVPKQNRPDLTGFFVVASHHEVSFTFYDFFDGISNELDELFWSSNCIEVDGVAKPQNDLNKSVFLKVTTGGHTYLYEDVILSMSKDITNNDFTVCNITLTNKP